MNQYPMHIYNKILHKICETLYANTYKIYGDNQTIFALEMVLN